MSSREAFVCFCYNGFGTAAVWVMWWAGLFWGVAHRRPLVPQWIFKISEDALHLTAILMFPQHVLSCAGQIRPWVTHYGFVACKPLLHYSLLGVALSDKYVLSCALPPGSEKSRRAHAPQLLA